MRLPALPKSFEVERPFTQRTLSVGCSREFGDELASGGYNSCMGDTMNATSAATAGRDFRDAFAEAIDKFPNEQLMQARNGPPEGLLTGSVSVEFSC